MFNIGFSEMLVIGVLALIVIGPKQLPEVAKVVGRLLGELKKATQDLSGGLLQATNEVKSTLNETKQSIVKEGNKIVDSVTNLNPDQESNQHQNEYDHGHQDHHHDDDEHAQSETDNQEHGEHGKS